MECTMNKRGKDEFQKKVLKLSPSVLNKYLNNTGNKNLLKF